MLGMVSNFNTNEHSIIGGEIDSYISRIKEKSGRDLFVLRYNKLGVFCICEWMSPRHDIFIDIMNLKDSLSNFTRVRAAELRQRLFRPLTAEETQRQIAESESRYLHDRQDDNEAEGERLAKVARGE